MTNIQDNGDSFTIKRHKPGYEALPIGGVLPIDLTGDGNSFGADAVGEIGASGLLTYATYGALMTYLDLEPAVRVGHITRQEQYKMALRAAWSACKDNGIKVCVLAIMLALLPGLGPVVGFTAIFGVGVMSVRLVKAFHRALSPEMRDNLKNACDKAGVEITGITDAVKSVGSKATGAINLDNTDEPLPSYS